jgi:uncharacterized repeat protein (TIGR03803 family)
MTNTGLHFGDSHGWEIRLRHTSRGIWIAILALAFTTIAQAQSFTILHSFDFTDGAFPWDTLIIGPGGSLYGTTFSGPGNSGVGSVFKLALDGTETTLYSFTGSADGGEPQAGLVRDSAGNFYGTTGPIGGAGAVFKLDRSGTETVLYRFVGANEDGHPMGNLVRDADGNLYGTVSLGSAGQGSGTVFKIDSSGTETILHEFTGGADGGNPIAGVIRDSAGNLYGTTNLGGSQACNSGCGVVFKIDPSGAETVLYSFTGGLDGFYPNGGLIQDAAGNLYGTTYFGGTIGDGTVFMLTPAGVKTVLYNFIGQPSDGALPVGNLIRDSAGNFYGVTFAGGIRSFGTVYKLDKNGKETVLYRFKGKPDGQWPETGLTRDSAGNLYGTTVYGGSCSQTTGCGIVFKIAP